MAPGNAPAADGTERLEGEATLFGYEATSTSVLLRPRSRNWRVLGAVATAGVALVVAPVAAVLPPHAPWVIGVLAIGGLLARRRFQERFTIVSVEGACPKCAGSLAAKSGRLRSPHPLPCEACHHESSLRLPAGALEAIAVD